VADRTTAKTARAAKPSSGKKEAGGVRAVSGTARTGRETGGKPKELRREVVPQARTGAQRSSSTAKSPLSRSAGASYLPDRRSEFVIRVLGNQRAADLLRVNKSQPSRWKSGEETPGPGAARRLVDLDHVLARLALVWDESLAADWLTTPNGFLEGATPMQVIESRGTTAVIEAIDAEAAGAYA
jgi:hypothetical protein